MDTATHTLIGICIANQYSKKQPSLSRTFTASSILASNLPDLDIIFSLFSNQSKLTYLLLHRGWSHSIVMALVFSVLLSLFISRLHTTQIFKKLFSLNFICLGLHLGFDYLNNYGLHPFSPFSHHWYYGDTLHIVEPFLLVVLLPVGIIGLKSVYSRLFWRFVWAVLIVLTWKFQVPINLILAILIVSFISINLYSHFGLRWIGVGSLAVVLMFFTFSFLTKLNVSKLVINSKERVHDIVLNPAPANPFCWKAILIITKEENYITRIGSYSWLPSIFPPWQCNHPYLIATETLLPIPESSSSINMYWASEFKRPKSELISYMNSNSQFKSALQFMRAPIWVHSDHKLIVSDLRYHFRKELGFADVLITEDPVSIDVPWNKPLHQKGVF